MKPNFLSLRAVILWFLEVQFLSKNFSKLGLGRVEEVLARIIANFWKAYRWMALESGNVELTEEFWLPLSFYCFICKGAPNFQVCFESKQCL